VIRQEMHRSIGKLIDVTDVSIKAQYTIIINTAGMVWEYMLLAEQELEGMEWWGEEQLGIRT